MNRCTHTYTSVNGENDLLALTQKLKLSHTI